MSQKACATCGEIQDVTEFVWRNKQRGIRWGSCRACQSKQRQRWYRQNKKRHVANVYKNKRKKVAKARRYIWQYLEAHPCVDCGEDNPVVLEFDHVRGSKKLAVADMAGQGYSIDAIKNEIQKCEIRCANCHRIKTHREHGWFRG